MTPNRESSLLNLLPYDNRFVRELPGDLEPDNFRRQVLGACYSRVAPTPVSDPQLVAFSREAARSLDLDEETCRSELFTEVFTGNRILPGMDPFAMCYGGHQFGTWAGQLGDGRAINLGEIINNKDERWMIQLKGAGPTPYSRRADGLTVLRSSIREFLCSEAMFHLGVATTRALSLTLTGEEVERDMFYDGHPRMEPGAVVCRISPSFTRFGNFQILAAQEETDLLKQLMDYTIETDFPHLNRDSRDIYETWFREICARTMDMIVDWIRVGFVHGVMNTDNMSILGLTIDYGPYGWLEDYTPSWTPNTTDAAGRRYCFKNQPQIALWNLGQLANALFPVIKQAEPLQEALDDTIEYYGRQHKKMMAKKLGLKQLDSERDPDLISGLLDLLALVETDYTLFFRNLARLDTGPAPDRDQIPEFLADVYYRPEQIPPDYTARLHA
nr:YdiU family protein [Desulfospira joergensenii]